MRALLTFRWVDVGTKSIAVEALQQYLSIKAEDTLHVGDQMSQTGNDVRARFSCPTLWVMNPKETRFLLLQLIEDRRTGSILYPSARDGNQQDNTNTTSCHSKDAHTQTQTPKDKKDH